MAIATYTASGAKATTPAKLDSGVFAIDINNHELLKVAYTAYLSNGRRNLAITKTRGLISGGGRKPWKQKGTGRARFGSSRNPIWRGGGIVFGPTGLENYTKKLNTNAKRTAIRQACTLAAAAGKISVIEDVVSKEGKTSDLVKLLEKLNATRNVIIVVEEKTAELLRASRNIQNVQVVRSRYLNVYSILNADTILFTSAALADTTKWLTKETK
jgi:large subunit ribosomal protein L4